MSKKIDRVETTRTTNTDDRKKLESLVDEFLDKVTGGMSLCEHCNQGCGDCTQPTNS